GRAGHRQIPRTDAEVLGHPLQPLVAGEMRIVDDRDERLAPALLDDGPAEERLPGANLAGDDDDRLAPFEGVGDLIERPGVRRALEAEPRIGSETERRPVEAEEVFVEGRSARRVVIHDAIVANAGPKHEAQG